MGKLCEIIEKPLSGEWGCDDDTGEGSPVLRTTNFTNDGVIDYSNVITRIVDTKKAEDKLLRYGDIIIEKSGGSPAQPVGRVVFFEGEDNKYLFNNFTSVLRLKDQKNNNPKYLFYHLFSNYKRGVTRKYQNKTTGILNLKLDRFAKEIEIVLPPTDIQKKITKILDTTAELLAMSKIQLVELDNLIKAIFYDMFGDPVKKIDSGKMIPLSRIAERVVVGYVGEAKDEYCEGGIPYLRTQNVRRMKVDLNNLTYINSAFHKKLKKSTIYPGDIVFSRVGVNRGMAAVIPNSLQEANIANAIVIGKSKSIESTYLAFYLNATFGKHSKFGYSVGSAQGVINTSIVKQWPVILAPLELQQHFAEIVTKIEEQKALVKKAIDETQYLFDSLMSQYFD